MTETEDKFEKWMWKQYHKEHYDKKEKDINKGVAYGIHLCINQYIHHTKPKLKAQILKENQADLGLDNSIRYIKNNAVPLLLRQAITDKLKEDAPNIIHLCAREAGWKREINRMKPKRCIICGLTEHQAYGQTLNHICNYRFLGKEL